MKQRTQTSGFLSAAAALAPLVALLEGKLFGGGKKQWPVVVLKRVVNKKPRRLPKISY